MLISYQRIKYFQDLLSEYMSNEGRSGGPELEAALDKTAVKVGGLRRQLSRAVVDHVSDTFLDTSDPLASLVEAAKAGREAEAEAVSDEFTQHAARLVEVASLACSMSTNGEGMM